MELASYGYGTGTGYGDAQLAKVIEEIEAIQKKSGMTCSIQGWLEAAKKEL